MVWCDFPLVITANVCTWGMYISWSEIVGICGTEQTEGRKLWFMNFILIWMCCWVIGELKSVFDTHFVQTIKIQNEDLKKCKQTGVSWKIRIVLGTRPLNTLSFLQKLWPFFRTSATFFHGRFLLALLWTSSLTLEVSAHPS